MSDILRAARLDDHDAVHDLIDIAFSYDRGNFRSRMPAHWTPDWTDWDQVYVIETDDRLVSLVRVFHQELVINGVTILNGGIGAVCTLKEYRGRGYMERLLNHACERMEADGYDLSLLGGDHHRYRQFGWVPTGRTMGISLRQRGMRRTGIEPVKPRLWAGDENTFRQISRAFAAHAQHSIRPAGQHRIHLLNHSVRTLVAQEDDRFAYVAVSGHKSEWGVEEYGGDPALVLGMLSHWMEERECGSIGMPVPWGDPAYRPYLMASSGQSIHSSAMGRVVSAERLWYKLQRAGASGLPDLAELQAMAPAEQTEALLGFWQPTPAELVWWPFDHI